MKKLVDEKDGKHPAQPNHKDNESSGKAFDGMAFPFMGNGRPYGGLAHIFTVVTDYSRKGQQHC